MIYLILFVVIGGLIFIVANQILIRKYYWGPSGRPRQSPERTQADDKEESQ